MIAAAVSVAIEVPGSLWFVAIQEKIAALLLRHCIRASRSVSLPSIISTSVRDCRIGSSPRSLALDRTKIRSVRSTGGFSIKERITALPVEPVPPRLTSVS